MSEHELSQMLVIRQKPKVAVDRIVQRVRAPLRLKEKQEERVIQIEKKVREWQKEVDPMKKSIRENEEKVKGMVESVERELARKVKTEVRVSL